MSETDTDALLPDAVAYRMDGKGGAVSVDPTETAVAPGEFIWVHFRRDYPGTPDLLSAQGIDDWIEEALTDEETRPRATVHGDGVLLNLRGANLMADADPEDMISVRLWLTAERVVGISFRPLYALADLRAAIERGQAPTSPGDLVAKLALRLVDRAEPAVAELYEEIDDLEAKVLDPEQEIEIFALSDTRRAAILLRRYMFPQRDALTTLAIEDVTWLDDRDRVRIREAADGVERLGEELETIRERCQIVHDELLEQRAERMNRRTLMMSVAAAIFLPLSLITGILGMNVGGIPWATTPWGFAIVCAFLAALALAIYGWFRLIGMFR